MIEPDAGLTLEMIRAAHRRIAGMITRTPVMTSASLDRLAGAKLFFKCENLQKTGAFKARGASNAVFSLSDEEAAAGVITHSSGNHAAALARAAKQRGVRSYIVMPNTAPRVKQAAVHRYGGEIVLCEPNLKSREATAQALRLQTGAVLIPPYDDLRVMAGQGTTALELMHDVPDLDLIVCPVGGGGLLSGIATAAKALAPGIQVIGAEPAGADDASRSFGAGRIFPSVAPRSIADGLLSSLGELNFAQIRRYVDDILTVDDDAIIAAMRMIWEVMKIIVEPSAAVGYAVVAARSGRFEGKRVAIVLTGGNLDLEVLPWSDAGRRTG